MADKKLAELRAEIEGSEPLTTSSNLNLEEDDEEAVGGEDDEDILVKA